MDMTNMPEVPPDFRPGDESAGLELVDVVLWVAKRREEGKPLSPELAEMFNAFAKRGGTDEVSLRELDRRWSFLRDLPEPNGPLPDNIEAQVERWEEERIQAIAALSDSAPVNNG
ncbi:hypothetical protein [Pseudodonghicola xiamenensis]|uniref:Uncharacterized protein n=1 Tax=Pseudodonghicola xiamenensis TaxID=337702 RepID=A0A8J3MFM7_9RHOB|nr:hypothetical protein [Pseudodonghicola xiamenensis]GHH06178.1 hypothetical protein GCM10010961_45070 [Pseudodonghicola xiamenensis]